MTKVRDGRSVHGSFRVFGGVSEEVASPLSSWLVLLTWLSNISSDITDRHDFLLFANGSHSFFGLLFPIFTFCTCDFYRFLSLSLWNVLAWDNPRASTVCLGKWPALAIWRGHFCMPDSVAVVVMCLLSATRWLLPFRSLFFEKLNHHENRKSQSRRVYVSHQWWIINYRAGEKSPAE